MALSCIPNAPITTLSFSERENEMTRTLTGRDVFAITVSAFAVIIGVNITMASLAIGSFPGVEVPSAYVASQSFDAERRAQAALGIKLAQSYDPARQHIALRFTDGAGRPVRMGDVQVLIGRSTMARQDIAPVLDYRDGAYLGQAALGRGKWVLHVQGHAADGALFRQRLDLWVKG
jgi:nitrogen fixation protein FixH